MNEIVAWFTQNYPNIKRAMKMCEHGEKQLNPYHIEGDCWSHTMMVCKVAELRGFNNNISVAALLHDIGKPKSRKVNTKNGHVQFYGHEELSSILSKPILEKMADEKIIESSSIEYILELIRYHGLAYKLNSTELQKRFGSKFYNDLMELNLCDRLGRFNTI